MGLLDALFSNDSGGGLLGGLPQSWQWQNPADANSNKDFLAALQQDPSMGNNLVAPQSPFGPVPNFAQQPQSVFANAPPVSAGFNPALLTPQAPQNGTPMQPPMQQPPQNGTQTPPPPMAPPQDVPDRTLNVGGYQMPQFGSPPPQMAQAQPTSTDLSAQSRQPQPEQALPPALQSPNFLSRIGSPDGLIARLTGNDSRSISQQNLRATFDATRNVLRQSGMSDQEATSKAMLAVLNPEAAKTILPEALTNKVDYKTEKDALGAEHGYWINKIDQTKTPADAAGAAGGMGQGPSLLAAGVNQYNPALTGQQYLDQFGPEVKAAVNAYIKGDVMPSGNPRLQAISTKAKEIAQKYGQDMGIPVSDALYSEKRKYYTELGTNSPNSAGGQAKAFNQGISHMTGLADNLEKLDNSNGMGIPLIAQGVNAARQAVSNQQSAISDEAKSLGQTVAGEVGKLFSGSAGGGVHERELTRERFDTVKSKPQLAAALRATLETMDGGLKALEQRRDSILGPNSGVDLVSNETRQNIAKVQSVIDRLDGKSTAPSTGGIPSGWSVKVH